MTEPDKNADDRSDLSAGDPSPSGGPASDGIAADSATPETAGLSPEFGAPFDYDATAEASLSEQPATSETGLVTGATGSASGSGPGWDVHSGVGNGPGWGNSPSSPPPSTDDKSAVSFDKPSAAGSHGQSPNQSGSAGDSYGPGPVYGSPDTNYPQADSGYPQMGQYPQQGSYTQQGPYGQQGPYDYQNQNYPPSGYPAQSGFPPPGYGGYPGGQYGVDPTAPFGRHPVTGEPLSDKSKVTAGVLQILLGAFGAGRFYLNEPGIAIAQLAVSWLTCGIGAIWPLIDGIMMLTGSVRDQQGRPLRD